MALRLFNTLSGKIEEFRPIQDNEVRMYACGPTVYDYGHIGNFRTFIAVDILRRFLLHSGYKLRHVMNITDVDDKIIRNAAQAGVPVQQYTAKYQKAFLEDAASLNIEQPELVRATEHIPEMADFVALLVEKWQSKIGPGRPGWHIECSVMSMEELGETFDLHAGGEDLIFPHHENEIAQSESATGKPFAHFWFHSRFLLVEGEKMSKSQGNFFTVRDLVLKGHKPSSIRYLLASVPYRNQLNFTFDGLQQAAASVERLRNFRLRLTAGHYADGSNLSITTLAQETSKRLREALEDDLNTAQAQGAVFDMLRAANAAIDSGDLKKDDVTALLAPLDQFDAIFAVLKDDDAAKMQRVADWAKAEGREKDITPELKDILRSAELSDEQITQKIAQMVTARQARNFAESDAIRAELIANGIVIEQTKDGVRWRRK